MRIEDLPHDQRLSRLASLTGRVETILGRRMPTGQRLWYGCEVRACFGMHPNEARLSPHRDLLFTRCCYLPADSAHIGHKAN